MTVAAIIPARYDSVRLPGKPLIKLAGKEMIRHVVERVQRSARIDTVWVATDDRRVYDCVAAAGHNVLMTTQEHTSGTSRLIEASQQVPADIYVNIQGDEPLMPVSTIDAVVAPFRTQRQVEITTACTKFPNAEMARDPNCTKVVLKKNRMAMYFSRAEIPFNRDNTSDVDYYLHLGIYAFRAETLHRFRTLESRYEAVEKLEQLRWLENDIAIYVTEVADAPPGVDTPEDVTRVESFLRRSKR